MRNVATDVSYEAGRERARNGNCRHTPWSRRAESLDQPRLASRAEHHGGDGWPGDAESPSQAADSGIALVMVTQTQAYNRLVMCSYLVDTRILTPL